MPEDDKETEPDAEEEPGQEEVLPKKKNKSPVSLTPRQMVEMFERWDTGKFSIGDMSRWYNCSKSYIHGLIQRREELGKDVVDQELEDELELRALEATLNTSSGWMKHVIKNTPKKLENSPMIVKMHKQILDTRKQMTMMPKDLEKGSAPIDFQTAMRLTELIPEEHRREYFQLMKGLTQTSGKRKSDLDPESGG